MNWPDGKQDGVSQGQRLGYRDGDLSRLRIDTRLDEAAIATITKLVTVIHMEPLLD